VERKKTGLTIIELLIVLGIIALLTGLLVPALSVVKKMAKETKQKAQFATIELALAAFKNDEGDYPPSDWALPPNPGSDYCGSQKLAEALLGWDLLGFHPNSAWRASGLDATGMVCRTLSTREKVLTWSLRLPAPLSWAICLILLSSDRWRLIRL